MITALDETSYANQSFEIGCEAYVSKPVDTERLVTVSLLELLKTTYFGWFFFWQYMV